MKRIMKPFLITLLYCLLTPLTVLAGDVDEKDVVLHFDQPQNKIDALKFKQKEELKPAPNDLKLIESTFMSNNVGER